MKKENQHKKNGKYYKMIKSEILNLDNIYNYIKKDYNITKNKKGEREAIHILYKKLEIKISYCRGRKMYCIDDNSKGLYEKKYTRHKKLSTIMKEINNRLYNYLKIELQND